MFLDPWSIAATIWSESFWCPPGLKWSDYGQDTPQFADLKLAILTAALIIAIRFALENAIFRPIGKFLISAQLTYGGDEKVSKIRRSRLHSTSKKFSESMWRFSFYLATSIFGWFFVLKDKPYVKDTMLAFRDYPHHPISSEEWWYYNIELAFYLSLIFTQFIDTKRKDFWQMFVHHVVTVFLLVLSWACNFHRVGSVVIAIHDVADVPMEAAKMAKYCNLQRLADLLFAIFTVAWIYTRCYLLPTKVIFYTTYEALTIIPFFPAYYVFNGLLVTLQILHLVWTYIIMRIVYDAITNDGMRDLRSDSEDSIEHHDD